MSKRKKNHCFRYRKFISGKKFETFFAPHSIDKSGESKVDQSNLLLTDGIIQVECYDWSKKYPYSDKLIVSIKNIKFRNFLMNAY